MSIFLGDRLLTHGHMTYCHIIYSYQHLKFKINRAGMEIDSIFLNKKKNYIFFIEQMARQ